MRGYGSFVLTGSLESYGGAEIVRARRVFRDDVGPELHLALYTDSARVLRKVVQTAEAAARVDHNDLARILEVGRYDGALYAVAEPAEGVSLSTLIGHARRNKLPPDPALAVAVTLELSRIALELEDKDDVWAAKDAQGLMSVFSAGLVPDAIVLGADGRVRLRALCGVVVDKTKPAPFAAPPGDALPVVFSLGQVLRAMLTHDLTLNESPRLAATVPGMAELLASMLEREASLRAPVEDVVAATADVLEGLAPRRAPATLMRAVLSGRARIGLVAIPPSPRPSATRVDEVRARLKQVQMEVAYPRPGGTSSSVVAPITAITQRGASGRSSVGDVFTDEAPPPPVLPARGARVGAGGRPAATVVLNETEETDARREAPDALGSSPFAGAVEDDLPSDTGVDAWSEDHPKTLGPASRAGSGGTDSGSASAGGDPRSISSSELQLLSDSQASGRSAEAKGLVDEESATMVAERPPLSELVAPPFAAASVAPAALKPTAAMRPSHRAERSGSRSAGSRSASSSAAGSASGASTSGLTVSALRPRDSAVHDLPTGPGADPVEEESETPSLPDRAPRGDSADSRFLSQSESQHSRISDEDDDDETEAVAADGEIVIEAPDNADVFVDAGLVGSGRVFAGGLSRGTHVVRVEQRGYSAWQVAISLAEQQRAIVKPQLKPTRAPRA